MQEQLPVHGPERAIVECPAEEEETASTVQAVADVCDGSRQRQSASSECHASRSGIA